MLPWFRMYQEFAKDPKVQSMSESLQRRLVMLFCLQCSAELSKLSDDELAHALRIETSDLVSTLEIFREKGFLDSKRRLRNWNKRQFKSDVSTERVQAFRKRSETVSATETKRHQIQSTDTETNTDTEEETKASEGVIPPGLDLAAWNAWYDYRVEIRKPLKRASILAAKQKLAALGSEQMAAVQNSIANGWTGLFPDKKPNGRSRPLTDHNLDVARRFAAKGAGNA
jgi:hypothetical protein